MPSSILKVEFREHCEDEMMNQEQFSTMLYDHRMSTKYGKKMQEKFILDSRNVKATHEDFRETNRELTARLFQNRQHITLDDVNDLRMKI